jgi:multiple sugar transport system permease protein
VLPAQSLQAMKKGMVINMTNQVKIAPIRVYSAKKLGNIIILITMILFGFLMLYPFLWMVFTSFKPLKEVYNTGLFNHQWRFNNYVDIWSKVDILSGLKASMVFSVGLTVSQIITSSLAGYAFAKIKFPLKNICFAIILSSMAIPYVSQMARGDTLFLGLQAEPQPYFLYVSIATVFPMR